MGRQERLSAIMKYFANLNLDQIAFLIIMTREILRDTLPETYKATGTGASNMQIDLCIKICLESV